MLGLMGVAFLALASAQPPAKDTIEKAADSPDKMICKRFLETGSLVRATRVCKTKAEWQRERDNIRNNEAPVNSCAKAGDGGVC